MAEMKFAVLFTAIDRMTDVARGITERLGGVAEAAQEAGEKISAFGEGMRGAGERLALTSALISEGAEKFSEFGEKIMEPTLAMNEALTRTAALTGMNAQETDKLREAAEKFSNTHGDTTAEQFVAAYAPLRQILGDTTAALDATAVAAKLAGVTHVQAAEAAQLLATVYTNLGTSAKQTGDLIAAAQAQFHLADPAMLSRQVARIAPYAKGTNTSTAQLLGILGETSALAGGDSRKVMQMTSTLQEVIAKATKAKHPIGLDLSHGLLGMLDQLKARTAGLSEPARLRVLERLVGPTAPNLAPLLDHLGELHQRLNAMQNAPAGVLDKLLGSIEKAGTNEHIARLKNNLANMFDKIGTPALASLNSLLDRFISLVQMATEWADHHQVAAGRLAMTIVGLGAALGGAVAILSTLGAVMTLAGGGIQLLGSAWTFALKTLPGMIMKGVAALQAFDAASIAAIVTNPFFWIPAAIIAIGALVLAIYEYWGPIKNWVTEHWGAISTVLKLLLPGIYQLGEAAYYVYQHWDQITAKLSALWSRIKAVFIAGWDWMKSAGLNLIRALADGILAGVKWVTDAASKVAGAVLKFFKGHSPPVMGPLHELGNLNLTQTIAQQMDPSPAVTAANRVAAAMAAALTFAAPAMMTGAPAFAMPGLGMPEAATAPAAALTFAAPAMMTGAPAFAMPGLGMPEAATAPAARISPSPSSPQHQVTMHMPVKIEITARDGAQAHEIADQVMDAIERHADRVARVLDRNTARRARTQF
jgi:TP901 family phage tail tape measure protein